MILIEIIIFICYTYSIIWHSKAKHLIQFQHSFECLLMSFYDNKLFSCLLNPTKILLLFNNITD